MGRRGKTSRTGQVVCHGHTAWPRPRVVLQSRGDRHSIGQCAESFAPEFDGNVEIGGRPERTGDDQVDQSFTGPCHGIHPQSDGRVRVGGNTHGQIQRMASFGRPVLGQRPHLAHELREDRALLPLASRREMVAEPHPVEFQSVRVITLEEFTHEAHLVFAHLGMCVVQSTVHPRSGGTVRHAPVLRMLAPEGRVQEVIGIVHAVDVVHAHGQPRRDILLAAAADPDCVRVEPGSKQSLAILRPEILRFDSRDRIPDRIARGAAEAGPHRVGTEKQVRDGRIGVLVHEGMESVERHFLRLARAEEMAVVLVDHQHIAQRRLGGRLSAGGLRKRAACRWQADREHQGSPGSEIDSHDALCSLQSSERKRLPCQQQRLRLWSAGLFTPTVPCAAACRRLRAG